MNYKNKLILLIPALIIISSIFFPVLAATNNTTNDNKAILFYGDGCPHCQKVESFIEKHNLKNKIIQKEVYHNPTNANEFNKICEKNNINLMDRGVPFLSIEDKCFIGDQQIINYFKNNLDQNALVNNTSQNKKILKWPMVVGAALVDAINPCAFAVLLILMMTILATGKRKKALLSGISFSIAIFISYFLMGLGLYSIVASFQTSQIFIKIIALIAIGLGLFNLKDFFWYGKGFLMEVPRTWRPQLKKIINSITTPGGAFLIGFLISLFLLPCTSGPYIVIISMLGNQVTHNLAIRFLILYNLIFIFPMILISFGTYWGLNIKKAEETRTKNLKLLHLIAGVIMLAMGIYLLTTI